MGVRLFAFFGVMCRGYSWAGALATYNMYNWIAASYIFTNFSLSHTHLPVTESDEYIHWVEYAIHHTTNLNPNPLTNWWMAYLNFQIEHHLFPSMPQFNHPKICHRVRALFEKHGVEYDVRPYWECVRVTYANLWAVGHFDYQELAHHHDQNDYREH